MPGRNAVSVFPFLFLPKENPILEARVLAFTWSCLAKMCIRDRAHIEQLDGISGHADREGLIEWLRALKNKPERVFLVHGDDLVCTRFAELLRTEYGLSLIHI